jgi:hypothetical protein
MMTAVEHGPSLMGFAALVSATLSALILLHYLVRRPALDLRTKLWLLVGLGVLPAVSAAASTNRGHGSDDEPRFLRFLPRHAGPFQRRGQA